MHENSQFVTYVANKIELKISELSIPTKFNTRGRSFSRATVIRFQTGRSEFDVWQRDLTLRQVVGINLKAIKRPGREAGHSVYLVPIL
jgi:hypothetical protein